MQKKFARPVVVVSKCLGFAACRWNQAQINDDFVDSLKDWVDYLPICPEVEAGMGLPRDPARLVEQAGGVALVQPATGVDWTGPMRDFFSGYFDALPQVDGFLLKSRSPSCGPGDVKIYSGPQPGAASRKGSGLFAAEARSRVPGAAMEHEGRVKNFRLREHFLTKLFALAGFRRIAGQGTMGALVGFHSANKLLLMAYNQERMRALGRIVANPRGHSADQLLAEYRRQLDLALARPPKYTASINMLMHAAGYFKKQLSRQEKAHFLDTLELYRQGRVLLSTLQALLYSWALRYEQPYLLGQTFFQPYPQGLIDLSDTGKGRLAR